MKQRKILIPRCSQNKFRTLWEEIVSAAFGGENELEGVLKAQILRKNYRLN